MSNEQKSAGGAVINARGDREEVIESTLAYTRKKISFGLIRLAGEDKKRRVSFKTLEELNRQLKLNPDKQTYIVELNLKTPLSKIVSQEVMTEEVTEWAGFTSLRTTTVALRKDFTLDPRPIATIEKERLPYICATVHYRVGNDPETGKEVRELILDYEKIAELLYMIPDGSGGRKFQYPHTITKIVRYGREVMSDALAGRWDD